MDTRHPFIQQQIAHLDRPELRAGDVVRVETKVTEGDKTRLQAFEGVVLSVRQGGPSTTFTVRRETAGFAVERIFPLYSPLITKIEITKRQQVRRAKLTYLRHAGRRRVKEDLASLQRHRQQEEVKKQQALEAQKRTEEAKTAKEKQESQEETTEKPDKASAKTK